MGEPARNLGRNSSQKIYVKLSGVRKALNRDFKNITKFESEDQYEKGDDAYLNRGPVRPWNIYTKTTGSGTLETSNDGYVQGIIQQIDLATEAGAPPEIFLVDTTYNADGTTTDITYINVILMFKRSPNGKFEKQTRDFTWEGVDQARVQPV